MRSSIDMKRRKNTKNQKRVSLILVMAHSLLLIAILIAIGLYVQQRKQNPPVDEELPAWEETSEEPGSEAQEETQIPQEPVFPKPKYDFTTEEITLTIKGISKEYTIAWVSDLHLVSDHEAGTELGDVHAEYLDAIHKRYEELAVTADGIHAEELWPEIVNYLNYNEFDGVIFGGDMMDYCSNSNVAVIKEGLDDLRIPYIYVRADHDYGFWYGGDDFKETDAENFHAQLADRDSLNYKYLDFEEFIVLGINRSTKDMTVHQYEIVKEMYDKAKASGKGVIIATHVPYASMVDDMNEISLEQKSMEVRNKPYYWGGGSYIPNDVTQQYLDVIYSNDTSVCAVLAGHLHASWDGMLTKNVRQHIFEPAYRGYIGIINIIPKEE